MPPQPAQPSEVLASTSEASPATAAIEATNLLSTTEETPWHLLAADEVMQRLDSTAQGLSSQQARQRLSHHGPNRLAPPRQRSAWMRFLAQFHNLLLYIMLGAALITALIGHWIDAGVLFCAVLINALIGFIQEGKAQNALMAIRTLLAPLAQVLRDGQRHDVDAGQLVPGDVVTLVSGDRVPADLRLLWVKELRIDEATLTGESLPVEKTLEPATLHAPLGDRFGMAYSGTLVVQGQASGMVVATGMRTELGKISGLLSGIQTLSTPLIRQIDQVGHRLAVVILVMAAATFAFGTWWRQHAAADMFMMAVALAASAIPEGLPAIMTVTLALGVQRMARRHAIVRHLPAVETLGSVSVICSDKTGTLTRNEMTVQRVICAAQDITISGVGYAPHGSFSSGAHALDPSQQPTLRLALHAALLCNDASLHEQDGHWHISGDPTEAALLTLAAKSGLQAANVTAHWPRRDIIPFESLHRFMATYHHDPAGAPCIFIKGAPEQILAMCSQQLMDDGVQPLDVDYWRRMASDTAARGLRLLALAVKHSAPAGSQLDFADISQDCTLLALCGIIDPPREEAIQAVATCQRAGIRVKMITGDHAETARAIGAQLAIGLGKPAITGAELALMDDAALRSVAMEYDIFARANPEHKLRLVQALQADGQVVAMTGDGVNDAPALKRADIGIAMGQKGTEAAKEAAHMVLTDDNFATIAVAVHEGRAVYENLKKFILFMLPTNGGEALIVIAAIIFNLTLPFTPAQILWINLVTSGALSLALAFEPAEAGLMQRPPRPPGEPLLSTFFLWRVLLVSLLMMCGALGLFLWELEQGSSLETARTLAVNAVAMAEVCYLFSSRSLFGSVLSRQGLLGNRHALWAVAACVCLQIVYTHAPPLQAIFASTDLSLLDWSKAAAAGLLVFWVAELEKWLMRRSGLAVRLHAR